MGKRGSHPALGHFGLLGVKRSRNHYRFDAFLGEFRKSQNSAGQVFVLRHDAKALFDEAIDAYGLRGIRIKTLPPQLIGANPVDLAPFEVRSLGKRTWFGAERFHFLSLPRFSFSFFFTNSNNSSAVIFLSMTLR